MIRYSLYSFNKILKFNSRCIFRKVISPESSRNSFIIIPEIPNKNNNLNLENILSISSYDIFVEFSRIIHNFETDLNSLLEKLNLSKNENLNFSNSVLEIEKIIRTIDSKFKYLKLIYYLKGDPAFEIIFNNLWRKALIANQEIVSNPKIDKILDIVLKSDLNNFQRMYINNVIKDMKIYGSGLPNEKISNLHYQLNLLMKNQINFNKSIYKSIENVKQFVNKEEMVQNTPEWLLLLMKYKGPENLLQIDLKNKFLINHFLKFCKNYKIRNQVWLGQRQFGGKILFDPFLSNYKNITEIREIRKDIANIFGEKNYCNLIFNSNKRMVKSLDEIMHILQVYKSSFVKEAEYEFKHVVDYAKKEKGLKNSMMLCDYEYIYNSFSTEVMKNPWNDIHDYYFDLKKIFTRIFFILENLFDISFYEDITSVSNKMIYSTVNSLTDEPIGKVIFLINIKSENNFIKVTSINDNNDLPISIIAISIPTEQPNLFNCLDIIGILGKILEGLYNPKHFEISPIYSTQPPDSSDIVSQFILNALTSSNNIFHYIFSELDFKLTERLIKEIRNNSFSNVKQLENLYFSYFDLEMWVSDKYWRDVQHELWSNFYSSESGIKFPYEKFDEWPCGAFDIFSDHIYGGVQLYSMFWTHHIVKSMMVPIINKKFYEWVPGEPINPNLSKIFHKFKKLFIEDYLSCKSISYKEFVN